MTTYADRLLAAVAQKGTPCILGLDPRLDEMPECILGAAQRQFTNMDDAVCAAIANYHREILDACHDILPATKLQIAFYEQYGLGGMRALIETVSYAKSLGLLVVIDAKRSDITSTAEAYANALLGRSRMFGECPAVLDADCITINPYLGHDSIEPFVRACEEYDKGLFVVVRTSNAGSADIQDVLLQDGRPVYLLVAELVGRYVDRVVGQSGYSSIGIVAGATFPAQAEVLRRMAPTSIFLVPGYGAQGASANDVARCFNPDGLGAVVNASRSLTYNFRAAVDDTETLRKEVRRNVTAMIADIGAVLKSRQREST